MMCWPWNAVIAIGVVFVINCGVLFAGWQLARYNDRRERESQVLRERRFVADVERFLQDR